MIVVVLFAKWNTKRYQGEQQLLSYLQQDNTTKLWQQTSENFSSDRQEDDNEPSHCDLLHQREK